MPRYILLTRLAPNSLEKPEQFQESASRIRNLLHERYPEVVWVFSYALLGPYDVVDLFEAPSDLAAAEVALLIRSEAAVHTEVYPAIEWGQFLGSVETIGHAPGGPSG